MSTRFQLVECDISNIISPQYLVNGQKHRLFTGTRCEGKVVTTEFDPNQIQLMLQNQISLVPEEQFFASEQTNKMIQRLILELSQIRQLLEVKVGRIIFTALPQFYFKVDSAPEPMLKTLLGLSIDAEKILTILQNE